MLVDGQGMIDANGTFTPGALKRGDPVTNKVDHPVRRTAGDLPQRLRLGVGLAYVVGLVILGWWIHGTPLPPFSIDGLWFYGGLLPILVARFIIEPYFTRPADALANGLALFVAAATLSIQPTPPPTLEIGRVLLLIYGLIVLGLASVAIVGRDSDSFQVPGRYAYEAVGVAGRAEVGFSLYLLLVTYAAHGTDLRVLAGIAAAWLVVTQLRPLERGVARLIRSSSPAAVGASLIVESLVDPRSIVARTAAGAGARIGSRVAFSGGILGRIVDRTEVLGDPRVIVSLDAAGSVPSRRGTIDPGDTTSAIGFVAEGSTLDQLHIAASAVGAAGTKEGRLVSASIAGRDVLYQVVAARVVGASSLPVERLRLDIHARKLGAWSADDQGFAVVPWVADAGSAVTLVEPVVASDQIAGIGTVPGTSYQVGLNIAHAVTHNTAILGILGVGKTSLSFELVSRMLGDGLTVIVLDLTREYARRFRELWSTDQDDDLYARLEAQLAGTRNRTSPPRQTAGNHLAVRPAIRAVLDAVQASDSRFIVLNPARLDVTIEDGAAWSNEVPLRRMTTVEVTREIAEAVLEFARDTAADDPGEQAAARICLVLEEAHSLVPEFGSTADKNEQSGSNGTARAILQGRKYGLGCLLITQRTANVTKTILNQCHTVFAMRSFDSTSEQFLSGYLGSEYAALLPSLGDRQAVLFGKASTSKAPVLIDLNNRDRFRDQYWPTVEADIPATDLSRVAAVAAADPGPPNGADLSGVVDEPEPAADDELDDLPF